MDGTYELHPTLFHWLVWHPFSAFSSAVPLYINHLPLLKETVIRSESGPDLGVEKQEVRAINRAFYNLHQAQMWMAKRCLEHLHRRLTPTGRRMIWRKGARAVVAPSCTLQLPVSYRTLRSCALCGSSSCNRAMVYVSVEGHFAYLRDQVV